MRRADREITSAFGHVLAPRETQSVSRRDWLAGLTTIPL